MRTALNSLALGVRISLEVFLFCSDCASSECMRVYVQSLECVVCFLVCEMN